MNWKMYLNKVGSTVSSLNDKYESMCLRAENKLTKGSTIDAKLDKAVDVVVPAVSGAVSKVTPVVKDYGVRVAKATCAVIDNLPATDVVGAIRQGAGYVVALSERATVETKKRASSVRYSASCSVTAFDAAIEVGSGPRFVPQIVVDGQKVNIDDTLSRVFLGDDNIPNALMGNDGVISVNHALLSLGQEAVSAVILHEQGHHALGHKGSLCKTLLRGFSARSLIQYELDADKYAIERGGKTGLLVWLNKYEEILSQHGRGLGKEMSLRKAQLLV